MVNRDVFGGVCGKKEEYASLGIYLFRDSIKCACNHHDAVQIYRRRNKGWPFIVGDNEINDDSRGRRWRL